MLALITETLAAAPIGPYQLQAAIAAVHDEAPRYEDTDWRQILVLFDLLDRIATGPMVTLNRIVAVAMVDGPEAGLALMDLIADGGALDDYPYLHAARADLLRRLGRYEAAGAAYRRALALTTNRAEGVFLDRRLSEIGGSAEV